MKITVLVTLMVFLAYFLVLYGGVGFIQDKRYKNRDFHFEFTFSPSRPQIWQIIAFPRRGI